MPSPFQAALNSAQAHITSSEAEGLAPVLVRGRIQRAINDYRHAVAIAFSYDEKKMAAQMLLDALGAMVQTQASQTLIAGKAGDDVQLLTALGEMIDHADFCMHLAGPRDPSLQMYKPAVSQSLNDALFATLEADTQELEPVKRRIHYFQNLNKKLAALKAAKAPYLVCYRLQAGVLLYELIIREVATLYEKEEYRAGHSLLMDNESALLSLHEIIVDFYAQNPARTVPDLESRLAMTREEFELYLAMCEGQRLLAQGDINFARAVEGNPEDIVANGLLAQDDYLRGLSIVTGKDLVLEGILLCRLARFHVQITKNETKSHALYLRTIELAQAFAPQIPRGNWYQEARDAVQARRDRAAAAEAKEWHNARAPIVEELKDELTKLEGSHDYSNKRFCEFILESWPPKVPGTTLAVEATACDFMDRKFFMKMSLAYHPDKNRNLEGDRWHVMSEEICKHINKRYNEMKGV